MLQLVSCHVNEIRKLVSQSESGCMAIPAGYATHMLGTNNNAISSARIVFTLERIFFLGLGLTATMPYLILASKYRNKESKI